MTTFHFHTAAEIVVGAGESRRLAEVCARYGIKKPFLVTDPGLVAIGLVDPIIGALKSAMGSFALFSDVVADPPESTVLAALGGLLDEQCDGVIGIGGGSSLDVAKVISVLASGQQSLAELYGVGKVTGTRLPLILMPTTAGTGSEVTPVAVITTGETTKAGVSSPVLLPDVALLDAELTVGLPQSITAMTGIDAMVHAIEAYTSKHHKNPLSDMLALEALRLLAANIRRVLEQPGDLQARERMLLGAMMAGQAFANAPVAAVHALAYPLGGHYHIPHGLSNSLMLPSVLAFNAEVVSSEYLQLAAALPTREIRTVDAWIDWFTVLIDETGLPATLQAANVPFEDLPMLAADAMLQQRLLVNNPREVDEATALALYRQAWGVTG